MPNIVVVATFVAFFTIVALVSFSRLKPVPQPARSLISGLASGVIAGILLSPLIFFGDSETSLSWLIIGIVTNAIVGAFVGRLGSAETIATKLRDDEEDSYIKPKDDRWFN